MRIKNNKYSTLPNSRPTSSALYYLSQQCALYGKLTRAPAKFCRSTFSALSNRRKALAKQWSWPSSNVVMAVRCRSFYQKFKCNFLNNWLVFFSNKKASLEMRQTGSTYLYALELWIELSFFFFPVKLQLQIVYQVIVPQLSELTPVSAVMVYFEVSEGSLVLWHTPIRLHCDTSKPQARWLSTRFPRFSNISKLTFPLHPPGDKLGQDTS